MKRGSERLHGASISAPDEGFDATESPPPLPMNQRLNRELGGEPEPSRPSRVAAALRVVLGFVVVVGASVGVAVSAHRYALTSPRFAVRHVEVRGGTLLGPEEVRAQGGIAPGANLFALDTASVERKLLQNPYVAKVRVARKLPGTLEVDLTERSAEALTVLAERLYLVSREGEPFKQVESSDPVDLPLISGLEAEGFARDRRRELERLNLGLEVLGQYARLGMSRVYVPQEVHIAESGDVTLIVGKEGTAVNLGKGPFRQRLLMAERVVNETRRAGRLPGIVFADNSAHPERVVVRMR